MTHSLWTGANAGGTPAHMAAARSGAPPARAQALSWPAWARFRIGRDVSMAFLAERMTDGDEAAADVLRAAAAGLEAVRG